MGTKSSKNEDKTSSLLKSPSNPPSTYLKRIEGKPQNLLFFIVLEKIKCKNLTHVFLFFLTSKHFFIIKRPMFTLNSTLITKRSSRLQ